ncbi:endonuclease/exonuclease/phosphatase family protein [Angustibacter peucedani]
MPDQPSSGPSSEPPSGPSRLRLVSYNVRDLLDDRDAVAHVVRSLRADVLCLQEAPRRWFDAHRLHRLAVETGLRTAAGARRSGGTAVLVHPRLDLVGAEASRLPVAGRFTRTRGYALATVEHSDGGRLTAVSVHLPLRETERADHAQRVLRRLHDLAAPPYVVAGDLNEPPDGPSWAALADLVHDAVDPGGQPPGATYPARAPRQRIDAVLLQEGVTLRTLRVAGTSDGLDDAVLRAASDHLPLVADVELSPAAGRATPG